MDRKLIDYLPPVWREVKEMQAVLEAEEPELDRLWNAWERTLQNVFIQTAGEAGICRWEQMLSLHRGERDTLDTRRFRVLSVLANQLPYTQRWLRQKLEALLGECELVVDTDGFFVEITANADKADVLSIASKDFRQAVPANLTLGLRLRLQAKTGTVKYGARCTMGTHIAVHPYKVEGVGANTQAKSGAHWKWGHRLTVRPGRE